uniref:Uncharacterized protein n=1 Tax=Ceratitis capitata TaxID=7213 RepID=W8BIS0_CERCA
MIKQEELEQVSERENLKNNKKAVANIGSVKPLQNIRFIGTLKSNCNVRSAEVRLRADVSHVASGSLYKCVKTLHLLGYRPTQINKGSRFEGMHLKNTVL